MATNFSFTSVLPKKEELELALNEIKTWVKKVNLTPESITLLEQLTTRMSSSDLRGFLENLEQSLIEQSLNEDIIHDPEFQSELQDIYNVLVENWSSKKLLSESQFQALYRLVLQQEVVTGKHVGKRFCLYLQRNEAKRAALVFLADEVPLYLHLAARRFLESLPEELTASIDGTILDQKAINEMVVPLFERFFPYLALSA